MAGSAVGLGAAAVAANYSSAQDRGYPRSPPSDERRRSQRDNDATQRNSSTDRSRYDNRNVLARMPEGPVPDEMEEDYHRVLRDAQKDAYREASKDVYRGKADASFAPLQSIPDNYRERDRDRDRDLPIRDRDDKYNDRGTDLDRVSSRDVRASVADEVGSGRQSILRKEVSQSSAGDALYRTDSGEPSDSNKSRVKIVDPPSDKEQMPRGILKRPKEQFPEDPNPIREGVAPLKDVCLPNFLFPLNVFTNLSQSLEKEPSQRHT